MRPWTRKGSIMLCECVRCGSVRSAEAPPASSLYDSIYAAPSHVPVVTKSSLAALVARAEPFRRTGRWLDVGFGQGALLEEAAGAGWSCHGTEVSGPALEAGRKRGWKVTTRLEAGEFEERSFDVASLVEVLEHVGDPVGLLDRVRRLVRPGGVLYLTTPNVYSLNRRVLGVGWSVFCPPEHQILWSRRGLARLLTASGFVVKEVRAEGLNPVEILGRLSARRRRQLAPIHRQDAGATLNAVLMATPGRRRVKRLINRALSATGLGDTLKAWAIAPSA